MTIYFINIICIYFINLPFYFAYSQNKKDIEKLKKITYTLADDSMLGRAAGSEGEEKAKRYLLNYYTEVGLSPVKSSFTQEFIFPIDSTLTDTTYNLIGFIDNKTDSTIIIGAHYDHIGMGGAKSRSLTGNKIHNGADDNASGVAIMLSLAEYLKKAGSKKFNYLFIAFSGHEDGLYGSEAFVTEVKYDLNKVKLMLNFDMVGRLDTVNPMLRIIRREKDDYLDSMLIQTKPEAIQLRFTEDNINHTDCSAFIKNNIPAITFSTGIHDDYHKVSDDAEKINYDGMYLIAEYIGKFIYACSD